MIHNEGEVDRIVRVTGGTFLMLFAYTSMEGPAKWIILAVSIEVIVSGFLGYSGLYKKMGISTSKGLKVSRLAKE